MIKEEPRYSTDLISMKHQYSNLINEMELEIKELRHRLETIRLLEAEYAKMIKEAKRKPRFDPSQWLLP